LDQSKSPTHRRTVLFFAIFSVLLLASLPACADAVLLLEEPINLLGHLTYAGHSAILLDRLCSDNHIQVRLCRADEFGTVIGRYQGANGYDWLAMDPVAYVYSVDSLDQVPASIDQSRAAALRESYRATHQSSFPKPPREKTWEELVGASYRRRIIGIHIRTTDEQNLRLMAWLNSRKNQSHFNLFFSNCSDFVRQALNVLYPGSSHRNILFDAGITTPKQLASSLHHYSKKHPEIDFQLFVIPQVLGNIPRSDQIYGVTESFVKTKPYLLPIGVLQPLGIGCVAASALMDKRYNIRSESRKAPTLTSIQSEIDELTDSVSRTPNDKIEPVVLCDTGTGGRPSQ